MDLQEKEFRRRSFVPLCRRAVKLDAVASCICENVHLCCAPPEQPFSAGRSTCKGDGVQKEWGGVGGVLDVLVHLRGRAPMLQV